MTVREFREVLDNTLRPLLRAVESGGGQQARLREGAERDQQFREAARRQEVREAEREEKALVKESRRFFESLGMTRKQAKRAAKAGVPHVPSAIQGTVTFSESETKLREARRELRGVERKLEKAERKDAARVFESLGLTRDAARLAAIGRS